MRELERRKFKNDFYVYNLILIFSAAFSYLLKPDLAISVLLFLFLPSIYLLLRRRQDIEKLFLASLTLGVLYGMSYNFVAEYFHAYKTIYNIWPFHLPTIGVTPLGDIMWGFLIPFSIIVFYEHFFEHHKLHIKNRFRTYIFLLFGLVLVTTVSLVLQFSNLESTVKPMAYFIVGLLSLLPLVLLFFEKHTLLHKIIYVGIFFAYLNALFEIVAIINNYWVFTGHYIWGLDINGYLLPVEEIIFWILPSAVVFVVLYEFFFDDNE